MQKISIAVLVCMFMVGNAYAIDASKCYYGRSSWAMSHPFGGAEWDIKCGNGSASKTQESDHHNDAHDDDPDTFWDKWIKDMEKETPDKYPQKQYEREKKIWANNTANEILRDLVNRYRNGNLQLGYYLSNEMMYDMANNGYQFKDAMENCLSRKLFNDSENVGNFIARGEDVAMRMSGDVRNCYRSVRHK